MSDDETWTNAPSGERPLDRTSLADSLHECLATVAEINRKHEIAMAKADPDGKLGRFLDLVHRGATVVAHPEIAGRVREALGPKVIVVANPMASPSHLLAWRR